MLLLLLRIKFRYVINWIWAIRWKTYWDKYVYYRSLALQKKQFEEEFFFLGQRVEMRQKNNFFFNHEFFFFE